MLKFFIITTLAVAFSDSIKALLVKIIEKTKTKKDDKALAVAKKVVDKVKSKKK
jgi:hypothetical protein